MKKQSLMMIVVLAMIAVAPSANANAFTDFFRNLFGGGPQPPTAAEYAGWVERFGPEKAREMLDAGLTADDAHREGQKTRDAGQDARMDSLEQRIDKLENPPEEEGEGEGEGEGEEGEGDELGHLFFNGPPPIGTADTTVAELHQTTLRLLAWCEEQRSKAPDFDLLEMKALAMKDIVSNGLLPSVQ